MVPAGTADARARARWAEATGGGAVERPPAMTPAAFDAATCSPFSLELRAALGPTAAVRTFEIAGGLPPGLAAEVHTDGRRPSATTVRTLRAAAAVVTDLYGRCPDQRLRVLLVENPEPKRLRPGAARTRDINSGFTLRRGSGGPAHVVVHRCEEMHRTLVHELLHVWRTHDDAVPARAAAQAAALLGAPRGVLLYEAYVEAVTWFLVNGFCAASSGRRSVRHIAAAAAAVSDAAPGPGTNAWAYYVGRSLLLADGGAAFGAAFLPRGAAARRLRADDGGFGDLVRLMERGLAMLGGPGLPRVRRMPETSTRLRMCACDMGPAFAPEGDGAREYRGGGHRGGAKRAAPRARCARAASAKARAAVAAVHRPCV